MVVRRKFEINEEQYLKELRRSKRASQAKFGPDAIAYDKAHKQILLFFGGASLGLPLGSFPELSDATAKDLAALYLTPSGDTIVAERLDKFISVDALVKAFLSAAIPQATVASIFGAVGGKRTSERKRVAAAANGVKGGRPRKEPERALAASAAPSAKNS